MDRLWKCSLTFIVAIAIATAALAESTSGWVGPAVVDANVACWVASADCA